ncbi:MFS transporter [Chloroflexota bacterium]
MNNPSVLSPTESNKPRFFYGYTIVFAAFLIMTVMWGTIFSFGVFFKPVSSEFGWTRAMTSGAYSLYMILHGALHIVAGRITDKFGPRIVVTVCGVFLGAGFLLMSQISSLWELYLFYGVVVGIGMGGSWVPMMSTVARWFVTRRGLMTGIIVSGMGVGTIIMPPLARWLISDYGWQTSYLIVGVIALVVVTSAAQFLKRDPRQMGLSPYDRGKVKQENLTNEEKEFSFKEALHTRQFQLVCVLLVCWGSFIHTSMVHIVPHVTDLGISATVAASILAVIGGLSIAGRLVIGTIADKIGGRLTFAIVFSMMAVAFLWLILAKEIWMVYLFALIFGFAFAGDVLQSILAAELFGLKAHGVILGVIAFVGTIGGAIGPLLAGYIFDTTGSYQSIFLSFAVLSLTALIITLLIRPISEKALK